MRRSVGTALLAVVLAIAIVAAACATNPVTGKREFVLMTESQEIAMGQEADEQIVAQYGLYPDQELQAYVSGIGMRMAALSHRPHLEWHFRVLDTEVVNAFAVPGGYIYLTRGILAHFNSEAELAMVIGHEIGHVTARHSVQQYSRQLLIVGGILIGAVASEKFRRYAPLALIGTQLLFLKFSRDQERQSDDLGVLYGWRSGYDPDEFDNFFETLGRMKEESGGGGGLPGFLSTHPSTPNRVKDVRAEGLRIRQAEPRSGQLVVGRDQYLAKIDGLVYGQDPRQGYVEGNTFYHPSMRFSFNRPDGWSVNNLATMVQMMPEAEDAFISFTLEQGQGDAKSAFDKIVSENELKVSDSAASRVNGLQAYHGSCVYEDDEDNVLWLRVSSIVKDGNCYNFIAASKPADFNRYAPSFDSTIRSFANLTDRNKLNRQPRKISIQRVGQNQTMERFLTQNGVITGLLNDALLINAKHRTDQVGGNTMMKLIK